MNEKQIDIPQGTGTYLLMLFLARSRTIAVGKLGKVRFSSGWYGYVGSAMGPGGVASRVKRHLKINKSTHWHIDYLRAASRVTGVMIGLGKKVREHLWASHLAQAPLLGEPVRGFGCTDCRCVAHLYYFSVPPDPDVVARRLKAQCIEWQTISPFGNG